MVTFQVDENNAKLSFKWRAEGKFKVRCKRVKYTDSHELFLYQEARITVDKNEVNEIAALIHSLWYPELTNKAHKSTGPSTTSSVHSVRSATSDEGTIGSDKTLASPRRHVVEEDLDSEEEVDEQYVLIFPYLVIGVNEISQGLDAERVVVDFARMEPPRHTELRQGRGGDATGQGVPGHVSDR